MCVVVTSASVEPVGAVPAVARVSSGGAQTVRRAGSRVSPVVVDSPALLAATVVGFHSPARSQATMAHFW